MIDIEQQNLEQERAEAAAVAGDARLNVALPEAPESERWLLCLLLNALQDGTIGEVWQEHATRLRADLFYHSGRRMIYLLLEELAVAGQQADVVTFTGMLRTRAELDLVGGEASISELFTLVLVTSAQVAHHLKALEDVRVRRGMVKAAWSMVASAQDTTVPWKAAIEKAEGDLFNLHEQSSRKGTRHVREVLQPVVDEIIEQYQNKGHIASGLQLGLTDLDRVLNGLKTGLFVIAARPSKGKTVLACQIALNVGCGMGHYKEFRQDRKPVLFFSLETTDRALTRRMLFNRWTVPISQARTGLMSRIQQDDLQRAVGELKGSEIYLHESFGMSIQELRATARMMVARHGIKLIIVDYLQLLTSSSKAAQYSRQAMIAEVSTGLKHLAHEFDISVIALAQLNRDGDKARPSMADLRESGQIEQDADYIGMICDAGQGGDEDEVSADEFMGLDIAKNKDGPTTTDGTPMVLYFDKSIFRLRSWTDSLLSNNTAKYQAGYDKPKGKKPGGKNEPTWSKLHDDD
jgi:replicative DNA helicase